MLVSAVQQNESAIGTHIASHFWISLHLGHHRDNMLYLDNMILDTVRNECSSICFCFYSTDIGTVDTLDYSQFSVYT